ncbi:6-carboxyhexanoate--CoA ligase [Desulfuromonas sp. AOP6]|uniref:6-carboxyhexanoate--CoA ligase n=1 Tax=Desulfuromonas sp. AOP6 TaxID=1566351 RepID=UPI001281C260|nr:6-carboxyhexanoate--CoA ligase [Desulfuromonas sp. AOP6]BCA79410.1 6-carboxyhexanoate--CoA ligase [Desulfuromonas sp. AOP6]
MESTLYSIRMHATRLDTHLSGAEALVSETELKRAAADLVERALGHSKGKAHSIRISIDDLTDTEVVRGRLPDLVTVPVADYLDGRQAAAKLLRWAGVSNFAITRSMEDLGRGAAPGNKAMRGAMLVDAVSGERLEPDTSRGVRVSRLGLTPATTDALRSALQTLGLDNDHVREALALAGKVLASGQVLAELCWSDDPDYTAGYVAAPGLGYVRFPHLKPLGEDRGGRAFFVPPALRDLTSLIFFLQETPWLADGLGHLHPPIALETLRELLDRRA